MTLGSLFDGISGFPLAASWAGIETKWISEIDPYCLKASKKNFPNAIQYGDIKEIRNPAYVDIISGGFPCQDLSIAGKGKGITGEKSGLWFENYRIINEVRPRYVVIENSPELLKKGFEKVLYPLSEIGYNVEWDCFYAWEFGMPHNRERLYAVAYSNELGLQILQSVRREINTKEKSSNKKNNTLDTCSEYFLQFEREYCEPVLFGMDDGVSEKLVKDQLAGFGNSVVPQIPFEIFKVIQEIESRI